MSRSLSVICRVSGGSCPSLTSGVRPRDHAMPLWMQILAVVIGATILVVQMLMRSERRGWRRVESWRCPECGSAFGAQAAATILVGTTRSAHRGLPTGGPILHCASCQRGPGR